VFEDLRSAYRGLRRSPFFAGVVVATLALGIGAASALFAVVDSALLRPLPGVEPQRLVWLQEYRNHEESGGTPPRFADWQRAHSFSAMCGIYSDRAIFQTEHGPVRLRILHTLGDPNKTLGLPLLLGRGFTSAENRADGQPVALLTAQAWRHDLGADPNVLKRTLRLGSAEYQVVGILDSDASRGIQFPEDVDVWVPMSPDVARAPRQAGFLGEVARLAPGVSIEGAQAEVNLIIGRLAAAYPATDKDRSATLVSLQDYVSHTARRPLVTLLAAAGAVLLIACVNIAGLLISRGLARQREAAIRVSVGAGFLRLARLFFAESILLAAAGGALGLAVADFGIGVLKSVLPPDIPHLAAVTLDWRVVACSLAVAALSAVLFGALPAWQFAARGQSAALKSAGKGTTDIGHARLRAALVIIEVALSLILLVTAGLLTNSFFRLRDQPAGFNAADAYSFAVPFGWDSDPSLLNTFASGALSRLTTSPGVVAAGVVDQLPLHGGSQSGSLLVQGVELEPALAIKQFSWRTASAGYFSAAGIPVKAGTLYSDWVGGKGRMEALITDRAAAELFPGGNALGHLIAEAARGKDAVKAPHWFRIVGIVGSVRLNPSDPVTEAGVYVPWGATYWPGMNFVVKSTRGLTDFSRLVRAHVQPLTNAAMVEDIGSLESLTAETRSSERVRANMLAAFAGVALALSAIGLFGTLSHEVTRRTQDFGVRLALGAAPRGIAWLAVRSALLLATTGMAIGIAASFWTSQFLRGLLFGIEPFDVTAYALAALLLLATAVLAALAPAAKAARIDPIEALRHD
jgi:predicted permease